MFGTKLRYDGKPGFIELVPTTMGFAEEDGTDVRMRRMYVYNSNEKLEIIYLVDPMGVWWANLPDVPDDEAFLANLEESTGYFASTR